MSAKASFLTEESTPANAAAQRVYIPRAAVFRQDEKNVAYVVVNSRVKAREIELGSTSGNEVEVTRGLSGGEDLASSDLEKLKDGALVRAKQG
jgi:HlyD family secretion protein